MARKKMTQPQNPSEVPDIKKINELMDDAEKMLKKARNNLNIAVKLLEPYLPKNEK